MKSVMTHNFSAVPSANIQRSVFDRSHGYKTAFDAGYLIPFFVDDVLPGDTFKLKFSHLTRLTTPIVPVMDNIFLETFFFFVPDRLVWDHFQNFMGERATPNDTTEYLTPQCVANNDGFPVGSVFDYMGIPPLVGKLSVDARFLRAYNLIYNEWFRDENLVDPATVNTGDGPDSWELYPLRRRGKRHDYFTSCLPWPQKGPGVELPLGGTAAVRGNGLSLGLTTAYPSVKTGGMIAVSQGDDSLVFSANTGTYGSNISASVPATGEWESSSDMRVGVTTDASRSGLVADLSSATMATINSLREAFQIQRMLERDAQGSRYVEILLNHFGVRSPDARLQRPEYLGGSSDPLRTIPVAQTSGTNETTPQGNLAAFGLASSAGNLVIDKSFTEHGIIIGLVNVRADLTYQQGLNRMWSRRTRYDFYWPTLAHLGEQAVLNKEIYAQGTSDDDGVFGYQERWAEYRYKPSLITGKMRSTVSGNLDVWHLSQKFTSLPSLNWDFIEDNPPISRILAVQNEPQFFGDFYFDFKTFRPMPVYSVPGLIDHF